MDPDTQSKISRVVAFVLGPVILALTGIIANGAQDLFGAELNGAELAAYLSSILLPVGGAIAVWLYNRGKFEIEKVKAENPALGPVINEVIERSVEAALKQAGEGDAPSQPPIGGDPSTEHPQ